MCRIRAHPTSGRVRVKVRPPHRVRVRVRPSPSPRVRVRVRRFGLRLELGLGLGLGPNLIDRKLGGSEPDTSAKQCSINSTSLIKITIVFVLISSERTRSDIQVVAIHFRQLRVTLEIVLLIIYMNYKIIIHH